MFTISSCVLCSDLNPNHASVWTVRLHLTENASCMLGENHRSLTHSLTHTHSHTHSLLHPLTHSLTPFFAHSHTHTLPPSPTHTLTHSHTHTLTPSFTYSHTLIHPLTPSFTHTHSHTPSLTHSLQRRRCSTSSSCATATALWLRCSGRPASGMMRQQVQSLLLTVGEIHV